MPTVGTITVTDEQMKNPRIKNLFLQSQAAEAEAQAQKAEIPIAPFRALGIAPQTETVAPPTPVTPWQVYKEIPQATLDVTKQIARQLLVEVPTKVATSLSEIQKISNKDVPSLTRIASNYLRGLTGVEGQVTTYAEDAKTLVEQGTPPWLAILGVGSKSILDTAITGDLIRSGAKLIEKSISVPVPYHQAAWEALGRPKTLDEAKLTYRTLAHEFHPDKGGTTELFSKLNDAYTIIQKEGIPQQVSGLSSLLRTGAELLNRPITELSRPIGETPFMGIRGQLPGEAIVGKPQPSFGLSIEPRKKIGYLYVPNVLPFKEPPLAQEAQTWKTGDSADRVQSVLKIPTNELAKNADYIEPYGNKGAKKYGFYVDENNPLEITVGSNGQKISHGYNYNKTTPQTNPLIAEAQKYKTAEEFVRAQGEPLYHGTNSNFSDFKIPDKEGDFGRGIYFTNDAKEALGYSTLEGKKGARVVEGYVTLKNPYKTDNYTWKNKTFPDGFPKDTRAELMKRGYDGVIFTGADGKYQEIVAFHPKQIKTKSQLTDFYNKAVGQVSKITQEITGHKPSGIAKDIEGGIGGIRGLKKVGLAPEPSPKIITTEKILLNKRIRDEARGTRAGFKVGYLDAKESITNQLRTTFETKISEVKRTGELKALKERILTRDADRVKSEIVDYVKQTIPISEQGKFIGMVKNAATQKDLIRSFIRIDQKNQEILLKNSIGDLKDTVEKLSESGQLSADYKAKIKEVIGEYELSGHTQKTIDKLKATQEFINKSKIVGEDIEMPQRIFDKLEILGRIPKEQLSLETVEQLQKEIIFYGQLGKTKLTARQALYDNEKELRIKELSETASPIESVVAKKTPLGVAQSTPEMWIDVFLKVRNYIQKTSVGIRPIDGLAEITGMQPMKAALDLDYGNYLPWNDPRFEKLAEIIERNKLTEVNFKVVGAHAALAQEGGLQRLIENNKLLQEELSKIKLSSGEKELYNFIRTENEIVYPKLKKWALDEHNVDVGKVDNYVSFHSDFDGMSDLAVFDRFGKRPEDTFIEMRTKQVEKGFIAQRQATAKNPLELDIVKVFMRHMDDVAYALTMGRDVKMYFEIVNSPALREKLGDVGTLAWLQWLDLMARKGGMDGSKRIAALDILRKNISVGVLGFRLSSALVQFSSFADTAATIGSEWATRGAISIATSKEWRNFIMDNFLEVRKAVGDDVAFRDFESVYFDKLAKIGFMPLQAFDGLMRSTAIAGAYQKLATEKGIAIDLANPNKELVQEATRLMRNSQGSSFFKDQPLAISGGFGLTDNRSLNKTLLTFQSFMLSRWDNIQRQIWRLGIKKGNYAKASMSALWLLVIATAIEETTRRTTKKVISLASSLLTGEETPNNISLAQSFVLNEIQNVPIAGSIVSSMMYSSNPIPVMNIMGDMISGGATAIKGKAFETKLKGGLTAVGAIGSMSGIAGSSQFFQILKGLVPPPIKSSGKNSFLESTTTKKSNPFLEKSGSKKNPFL